MLALTGSSVGPAVDVRCSSLTFFADPDTARSWAEDHPEARSEVLAQEQAEVLGRPVFGPQMGV
ncbi:organomercurial lyase [Streptomyces nigrescens]